MRTFYIVTNEQRDLDFTVTKRVQDLIISYGGDSIRRDEMSMEDALIKGIDCVITLGGDGTLIRAAGSLCKHRIPFIGINLGHLGYLTEIEVDNLEEGIKNLVTGPLHMEERMMLTGSLGENREQLALNDIVLKAQGIHKVISFEVFINYKFVHSYKADGLIISTPTGSTGYNMSAGGPIVEPTAQLILMTPICAHSLHGRSIVFSSTDIVEVVLKMDYDKRCEVGEIAFDGEHLTQLFPGEKFKIKVAEQSVKMWKLDSSSFIETMRKKMEG